MPPLVGADLVHLDRRRLKLAAMESPTADPHLETTFLYMLAQLESSATGRGGSCGEAVGREGLWSFRAGTC